MTDSNQALSWIVFVRDRIQFETRYPALAIETITLMPWFTYFVSGGLSMRCLVPRPLNPVFIGLERLLQPFAPALSLFWQIRVRKKLRPPGG